MFSLYAVCVFVFGLIIGSFLNVVVFRIDDLKTIVFERSHCPKCKTILKWYDLIPFFSFMALRARCRYCKEKISWQYPIVELSTALIFLYLFPFLSLTLIYIFILSLFFPSTLTLTFFSLIFILIFVLICLSLIPVSCSSSFPS
jgi:leader peptidase (prepilin peptidase)/N-methyltransferase